MSDQPRRTVLGNGLTIITKEMHEVPLTSFWVWYRVGSRNEITGKTGISHWVEHMQFKGTPSLGKGQIFDLVSANGGSLNAFTWIDFTAYFETLPSDRLDLSLQIESDRMNNSLFDPQEVESERTVILSEREGAENSPGFLLTEEVNAAAFKAHPYGHQTIGWKSDLLAITRDDLFNHYRMYYTPNNAIVVAVGDFATDELLEKVERYFGSIPVGPAVPPVRTVEPPQIGERRAVVRHPAGTAYFTAAYHAPAVADPDAVPMMVLDAILSGGKPMGMFGARDTRMGRSSRLYRALVDSGLARGASSSFNLTKDPYLFEIDATLRAGVSRDEVERVVFEEVCKIQRDGVSQEELERAKKQMRAQFIYGSETAGDQGYWLGNLETIDSYERFGTLLEALKSVRAEDVQRVASAYLTEANRTVGWLIPTPEPETAGGGKADTTESSKPKLFYVKRQGEPSRRAPAVDIKIQRTVLGNGVVVLGHQTDAVPMVALRASMIAGSAYETDPLAGLASITGSLLIRGTESRSFEQLSEETDSLGIALNVDPGRWTVQLSVRALSEDFPRAVEIMVDVLRRPTFPEAELEKLRGQVLTGLREQANNTAVVAARRFYELAYPEGHPYHRWPVGSEQTISGLTRDDAVAFYRQHYRPQALTVSVVGAVAFEEAVKRLEATLGDWPALGEPVQFEVPAVTGPAKPERQDIFVAGKTQSDIVMGLPTLSRKDPDYYALSMANLILGQLGLMGRLGEDVRDRQGLAYHVGSDLQAGLGPSPWVVSAGVNPANVQRAIDSITKEVERWRNELVSESEIEHAKSYLTGRLPLALESSAGVARMLIDIEFFDLGLDYLRRYPGIVNALTRERLRDAARRWVQPEQVVTVVAGPQL